MSNKITPKDPLWGTMYALFAPLIVWPGYEESSRHWTIQAQKARFEKILSNDKSERATDTEVAIYLSTASLVAPMAPDWAEVYFRAANKVFPAVHDVMERSGSKIFTEALKKPTAEEQKLHDDLAKWIYEKQKEALAKKLGGPSAKDTEEKAETEAIELAKELPPFHTKRKRLKA